MLITHSRNRLLHSSSRLCRDVASIWRGCFSHKNTTINKLPLNLRKSGCHGATWHGITGLMYTCPTANWKIMLKTGTNVCNLPDSKHKTRWYMLIRDLIPLETIPIRCHMKPIRYELGMSYDVVLDNLQTSILYILHLVEDVMVYRIIQVGCPYWSNIQLSKSLGNTLLTILDKSSMGVSFMTIGQNWKLWSPIDQVQTDCKQSPKLQEHQRK